jgi:hypothetical protein
LHSAREKRDKKRSGKFVIVSGGAPQQSMTDRKTASEEAVSSGQSGAHGRMRGKERAPSRPLTQTAKYVAINVFLLFHIVAIACWSMPINGPLIPLCRNLVRPYLLWAGLFQSWDMFAPSPKAANTYIDATLVYKDGSIKTWTFPRMEQMGLREKLFKERYRKFAENLQANELDDLLPDAARHIARLNSTPANPVKTVILVQNVSFNVPGVGGENVPQPWQSHVLLGYGVRPEDLR